MSVDECISVHEWPCGSNWNFILKGKCKILYWTSVTVAADGMPHSGRKFYFHVSKHESKNTKHRSTFNASCRTVFDSFAERLGRFAYVIAQVTKGGRC